MARVHLSAFALVVVAALGAGGAVGLLLAPERPPESLASAAPVASAPATAAVLDDSRTVAWQPRVTDGLELAVERSGLVTSSRCEPGGQLASGEVAFSLDARPVIALHTGFPLYRDLASGAKGPDVKALQEELARLGYDLEPDGHYGGQTVRAVSGFKRDRGLPHTERGVALGDLLQLPTRSIDTAECPKARDRLASGEVAVRTAAELTALALAAAPENLVAGDRIVVLGDAQAPAVEGLVTDPGFLDALADSDLYRARQQDDSQLLQLVYRLAEPVEAVAVPAGALFGVSGDTGCVTSGGSAHRVRIVTSALGSTYVVPPSGVALTTVQLAEADDRTAGTCG